MGVNKTRRYNSRPRVCKCRFSNDPYYKKENALDDAKTSLA